MGCHAPRCNAQLLQCRSFGAAVRFRLGNLVCCVLENRSAVGCWFLYGSNKTSIRHVDFLVMVICFMLIPKSNGHVRIAVVVSVGTCSVSCDGWGASRRFTPSCGW